MDWDQEWAWRKGALFTFDFIRTFTKYIHEVLNYVIEFNKNNHFGNIVGLRFEVRKIEMGTF